MCWISCADPAAEVALAGDQLAVHQLLVGDLDAVVAGDRDGLLVGEAAFDLLACSQAQLDDGVEHDVLLVLLVNIGEQVVRHADLVGV